MFATRELIEGRKKESKRLQAEIKTKLLKVQKLAVIRVIAGEDVVFEINSYAGSAQIHSIGGICSGDKHHDVHFSHYDHMNYEYDNCICEYYQDQIVTVDYWIKLLS